MEQPSARMQALEESATIVMAQKSRELKAAGKEVIDLSLGEPDFTTPKHICEAAKKAIDDGYHHYPPVPGYADLRQAIASNFKKNNGLDYAPDQIVVSTGAKQTLANVMMSVLNDGDEVMVPIPYWVSYAAQVQLSGGKLVPLKTTIENDFKVTPEQVRSAMTEKSRLFLFSSPCNPTGTVYTRQELDAIAVVLAQNPRIIVVSDEIYEHINFRSKHVSIGTHPKLKDRVVTVNGVSKGFAMTGWRLGYMGAPQWIAKASAKMQGQVTSGANTIAQRAALAAITSDLEPTYKMRDAFEQRRDLMVDRLSAIEGMKVNRPQGAFYLFPDVSHFIGKKYRGQAIGSVDDLSLIMLEESLVSTVSGRAFGDTNCIRISYANSEENLEKAAGLIQAFFQKIEA